MTIEIDFRNLPPSAALSGAIRKRAAKLNSFCDSILKCRVTVESPHHHHHQGVRYAVHIRITGPGMEVVVSHQPESAEHEDAFVAIHDAFDAAERQLRDHVQQRRGEVKRHSARPSEPGEQPVLASKLD